MTQTTSSARVINSTFMLGTDDPADLPLIEIPEIAFIGRTNVGKSTLINRVTGRRSLARASSTPGRTQQFNLFEADVLNGASRHRIAFMDLPGFGYSQFSKKKRIILEKATFRYLTSRTSLSAVCLLQDIRRDPKEEEDYVAEVALENAIPLVVVITKADKLTNREVHARKREILRHYGINETQSCLMGSGIDGSVLVTHLMGTLGLSA